MVLVSIIIPAYNEEKRIPATLAMIGKFIKNRHIRAEVIVVDDGSTDNTIAEVKSCAAVEARVIKNPHNMGKGASVREGVLSANGDLILFTDADLSTPIKHLEEFIELHERGYDVIVASRDLVDSKVMVPQSNFRELSGKIFNFMVRAVTGLPVHDTQCGFKSFTRRAARTVFPRQTVKGFGFDVEVLYIARLHKLSIHEAPVEWYNDSATKVHFLRDSLRMFLELFKIRMNGVSGKYK
ncbi:MAG: glycosyltransferase family 2 protein [Spirochaetia bacterium]|nr:glycosyltransferase family 2 protein [Spirochaetia bacterium]